MTRRPSLLLLLGLRPLDAFSCEGRHVGVASPVGLISFSFIDVLLFLEAMCFSLGKLERVVVSFSAVGVLDDVLLRLAWGVGERTRTATTGGRVVRDRWAARFAD